jgi:hypothetical protein
MRDREKWRQQRKDPQHDHRRSKIGAHKKVDQERREQEHRPAENQSAGDHQGHSRRAPAALPPRAIDAPHAPAAGTARRESDSAVRKIARLIFSAEAK